jgi:hypothetical protein
VKRAALVGSILAVAVLIGGCGGQQTKNAADGVLQVIDDAPLPTGSGSEDAFASAMRRGVCDTLNAYSSDPAQIGTDAMTEYAKAAQISAGLDPNGYDPAISTDLIDELEILSTSQDAAEVTAELCP